MKVKNKIFNIFALLVLSVMLISVQGIPSVLAYYRDYTDALTDLSKDVEFNAEEYPDNPEDYSLKVIQIAESTDSELFIYTYQPCQKTTYLTATEINMSLTESADDMKLYGLTLLNCTGVFCKYKVNDFTVSTEATRNYNITSIFREWIKGVDEETGNNNEITAVSFPVGQLWTATAGDNGVIYSCVEVETIQVLSKYVGFITYNNGFILKADACDSHFVAFSTDKKIDNLYEAEIYYKQRSVHKYHKLMVGPKTDYGETEEKYELLTDKQEVNEKATGWLFGQDRKYKRIESVTDFLISEDLSAECKENIAEKQWVLRFAETSYTNIPDGHDGDITYTEVTDVSILRLKFETDGKIYNLGVIDNKQSGDYKPDNNPKSWLDLLCEWLEEKTGIPAIIWKIIICALPFIILLPILSAIFPVVGQVLLWIFKGLFIAVKWILKAVWYIISAPFKLIARAIRRRRGEE